MRLSISLAALAAAALASPASATLLAPTGCTGNAVACVVTDTPPTLVERNPNDSIILMWDEKQNVVLTEDLPVDRVFDPAASFVGGTAGNYFLRAGTVVSSHYVQWDVPGTSPLRAQTTINADSQIFAFIYADQKLFNTDALLGLDTTDYNDFTNRGLEGSDSTVFSGSSVYINWAASSPGDWARMLTAYSPTAAAADVPVPAALPLMAAGLAGLGLLARRRKG
ncbi:VPLPA-CTERM sorting domain-containing protein [Rhodovulum sp. DZ06]|uniref:VPLPA-CTERM sorting domain-containing protein n=1 Tax=Rhodovulum sp. DZ06 TaxID=3425126 RepID=UPI003D34FA8E